MARLDLDTATIAGAGAGIRAAAASLTSAGLPVEPAAAGAGAGEAMLARAIEDLVSAWAPAHEALGSTLEALATALFHAAETFEGAEQVTAEGLAELIAPVPARPSSPRLDGAV